MSRERTVVMTQIRRTGREMSHVARLARGTAGEVRAQIQQVQRYQSAGETLEISTFANGFPAITAG